MSESHLLEIDSLARAFQRDEELMTLTNYLAAFRSTPEGRAFIMAHLRHMDSLYERYEELVRKASMSIDAIYRSRERDLY